MLKSTLQVSNVLLYKSSQCRQGCPKHQIFKACISTNSAINRSLRRSQNTGNRRGTSLLRRKGDDGDRGPESTLLRARTRRPNQQQGLATEDMERQASLSQRYKVLKRSRTPTRTSGSPISQIHEDVGQGHGPDEFLRNIRSQYDYSPHPGGNRAIRRASRFGHKLKPSSDSQTIATNRRARRRQAMREGMTSNNDNSASEDENGDFQELSLPRDLYSDSEIPSSFPERNFTMGRQTSSGGTFLGGRRFDKRLGKDYNPHGDPAERDHKSNAPLSIPYTTPASEFLYGTSVVVATLLSSRRKLYKLYIYDGDNRQEREQDLKIRKLALEKEVVVERVKGDWLRVMDKMSTGRPHNGYILEASPLQKPPVIGLQPVKSPQGALHLMLDHQSREDEAINGTDTEINYEPRFPRYPFVLLLDGILDPGNLGAILRTAFFLGVDAVAIANRSSASISPVALKASAGAAEALPLVSVDQPGDFIDTCQKNGWKVYASATPRANASVKPHHYLSLPKLGHPVRDNACILILGNEGEGLRWTVQRKADYIVAIESLRLRKSKVDSLNVSVAAGLLCEAFLRIPVKAEKGKKMASPQTSDDKSIQQERLDNVLF